jgi:hypothetical protein
MWGLLLATLICLVFVKDPAVPKESNIKHYESESARHNPNVFQDPEGAGTVECKRYIKLKLAQPATADFDFGIESIWVKNDGTTTIEQKLSAKNALGVPTRLLATCYFNKNGITDGLVREIIE